MPYWKKLIDEMTSDERFRRVVEILTRASVRLLEKQRAETAAREKGEPVVPGNALTEPEESKKLDFTAPEIYEPEPRRGRIPFGRRRDGPRIKGNEIEMSLIKDIQRLAAEGLSSEQIAQRLNQEDKVSKRVGLASPPLFLQRLRRNIYLGSKCFFRKT